MPHPPPAHPRRRLLPLLVGGILFFAVLFAAMRAGDAARFAAIARDARPAWLLAGVLLQALTYTSEASVWWLVLRRARQPVAFVRLYALAVLALLTSQTVPSAGMAGSFMVFQALRHWGVAVPAAMATVLVELVGYATAYGLFAAGGVALMLADGSAPPGALFMSGTMVALGIGVAATVLWLTRPHGGPQRPWQRFHRLQRVLTDLSSADPGLSRHPPTLLAAVGLRGANFAVDALTLWVCLFAVGANAPLGATVGAFLIGSMVRSVGFVPGGLGTFEAATVGSLTALGVELEPSLAAVVLFRGLSYWLPMPFGIAVGRKIALPMAAEEPDGG